MRDALEAMLRDVHAPAIAVSGGVDSMTLAAVAALLLPDVEVMHAVSPAVPAEATTRVRRMAGQRQWRLTVLQAGEFADPDYRANPVNRCFYCKTNLYAAIRTRTARQILSGANLDDLGEYRPGLDAARAHGVRHPFIEAGIDKQGIRRIARDLGLEDVAELPSSPCLSSRVETGIPIDPQTLEFIHEVERSVVAETGAATVRCRVRATAIAVELDPATLQRLSGHDAARLTASIAANPKRPRDLPITFEPYRNGSAFLIGRTSPERGR